VWYSQYDPENNYSKGPDFPSAVLQYHYPHIPNLGDMLQLRQNKIYHDTNFNVLVGGTPCQSFSIAGLRKGLGDERGNLALEFVRILTEKRPAWFIWENVPGVLTSGKQGSDEGDGEEESDIDGDPRDFACLLSAWTGRDIAPQEFEKSGVIEAETEENYSIAWRILDSQYFGVPQRRRRIFVVGHLGKDWRPPVAVLFEQDSLRRDFTPGGKKRKGASGDTSKSAGGNSEQRVGRQSRPAELASTLDTTYGDKMGLENKHINSGAPLFVPHNINGLPAYRMTAFGSYTEDETASALKKRDHKDATDLVLLDRASFNQGENALFEPKIEEQPTTSPTVISRGPHAICYTPSATPNEEEILTPRLTAGTIDCRNDVVNDEISGTLQSKENGGYSLNYINPVIITEEKFDDEKPVVVEYYRIRIDGTFNREPWTYEDMENIKSGVFYTDNSNRGFRIHEGVSPPLLANMGTGGGNVPFIQPVVLDDQGGDNMNVYTTGTLRAQTHGHEPIVALKTLIRRLTPKECLRLQGFPDDYLCNVPGYSDSKAYSACGNSMTTFVMGWLGKRVQLVDDCLRELREPNVQGSDTTKLNS
jgi:DNA (cytosine-5)-methyltransferase 1